MRIHRTFITFITFVALAVVCLVAACDFFPPVQQSTSAPPATMSTPSAAPSLASPTPKPTPTPTAAPKLMLSGGNVGTQIIGTSGYDEVSAYLTSVLGAPTQESLEQCELNGPEWKTMVWQGLRVSFDNKQAGTPLLSWTLVIDVDVPDKVQLIEDLPTQISFAELNKRYPAIKLNDLFGTGRGPWIAEPLHELYYVWDEESAAQLSRIVGGGLLSCE